MTRTLGDDSRVQAPTLVPWRAEGPFYSVPTTYALGFKVKFDCRVTRPKRTHGSICFSVWSSHTFPMRWKQPPSESFPSNLCPHNCYHYNQGPSVTMSAGCGVMALISLVWDQGISAICCYDWLVVIGLWGDVLAY